MPTIWNIVLYAILGRILWTLIQFYRRLIRRPLPPGPTPLPWIGNAHQLSAKQQWKQNQEWSKTYGDIIHVDVLGQPIVILDSVKCASDLLEKRSSIYSDRPQLVMHELCGFTNSLVIMAYGEQFKKVRAMVQRELLPASLEKYAGFHETEVLNFAYNIAKDPDGLIKHLRYYAGSLILKVTYGYQVTSSNDPRILLAEELIDGFSLASVAGGWIVDLIPQMRYFPSWMPGMNFKRWAMDMYEKNMRNSTAPYVWAKEMRLSNEMIRPNYVTSAWDKYEGEEISEEEEYRLTWACAAMYGGGADTTVASLSTFFLAMCFHPEVQARARQEIDKLTGGQRLPNLNDRAQLPYIEAIVRETLRWHPVIPLAAHKVTQDDVYKNYIIPKGALVIANVWSMLHDPSVFEDPDNFNPNHFIGNPEAVKIGIHAFGFGRRSCPGLYFAEASMFIAVAVTLALFTISDPIDLVTGTPVDPDVEWKSQIVSHPLPFKCNIKPRYGVDVDMLLRDQR